MTKKTRYYAVARGLNEGIFTNINEYLQSVNGFSNALGKSFKTQKEASTWLNKQQ
jgi:viroplasmin and RNaseH domain-containing protein